MLSKYKEQIKSTFMLFPKYGKTRGAAVVIKQEALTFDLEVA
jgi:hypothetical protein